MKEGAKKSLFFLKNILKNLTPLILLYLLLYLLLLLLLLLLPPPPPPAAAVFSTCQV